MRVLRVLSGHLLACGCLVGTYETYEGRTVTLVDARGRRCAATEHRVDAVVSPSRRTQSRRGSLDGRSAPPSHAM